MWSFHEVHLLRRFPEKDWRRLTPAPYPRLYRGLPRLFARNQPLQSKLAPPYDDSSFVLRSLALKAVVPLYRPEHVQTFHRIGCRVDEIGLLLSPQFPRIDFVSDAPLMLPEVPFGLHFLQWGLLNTDPPFEINPDLLALSENRLGAYPMTRRLLRLAWEQKLYQRAPAESEWVEEWAVQQSQLRPLSELEAEITPLWDVSEARRGLAALGRILRDECAALPLLKGLAAQVAVHVERPALAQHEEALLDAFVAGDLSLSGMLTEIKAALAN